MRRRTKVSTEAASGKIDNEQNFWPSYADMMSSFALILFFLMLLSYLSNIQTGNNLRNTEERLSDTLSRLTIAQSEVAEANAELQDTQNQLNDKENELNEKEAILATVQIRLDEKNAELENTQFVLAQQQATINSQAQYVAEAQVELEKMHGQMEMIVGVRREVLDQIKASIDSVSGSSSRASIGENGNIILNDTVFFDTNKWDLKPEALGVLNQLVVVFSKFLSDPENARYIDSIIISGHTDADGPEDNNRTLSTNRANSVLNYMLTETVLTPYSDYFWQRDMVNQGQLLRMTQKKIKP